MPRFHSGEPRVLVAGFGNIFLGDDAFGVEVVSKLSRLPLPDHVRVIDVGLRSVHLAFELRDASYDTVILVDVVKKHGEPGSLYLLEVDPHEEPPGAGLADGHAVLPHHVATLVRQLGGEAPRVQVVGCEPAQIGPDAGLSPAVAAAVDEAVRMIVTLLAPEPPQRVEV